MVKKQPKQSKKEKSALDTAHDEFVLFRDDLFNRWGKSTTERLFRKLVEETGEYSEALSYKAGNSGKVKKFEGGPTPDEKITEEIADVFLVAVCLAWAHGLSVTELFKLSCDKLNKKRK